MTHLRSKVYQQSAVPWTAFGPMLREIAVCRPLLVEIGLNLPSKNLTNRYFSWLMDKGMIRLKTTAEILADEPITGLLTTERLA